MRLFKSNGVSFSDPAFSENRAEAIHRWVPWIAGFSSRFVAEALEKYLPDGGLVMDPFTGVGTTIVEVIRRGRRFRAVGFETNPYAAFAARTKVAAVSVNPGRLRSAIERFSREAASAEPLEPPAGFRSRVPFFSPRVEEQVLRVLAWTRDLEPSELRDLFRLAFAAIMVKFSNYTYEPSLGTRRGADKPDIDDAPVVPLLHTKLTEMVHDLESFQAECPAPGAAEVHQGSWSTMRAVMQEASIDLVITSPPYANNYHYLRNTRPQLWWLGFVTSTTALREIELSNFGKFWQTVREQPEIPLGFKFPALEQLLDEIRQTRHQQRVYDGRGWANYLAIYFNDSFDFLKALSEYLAPGGRALIVIGNSVVQGHEVRTDEIWADIAESNAAGLQVEGIEVVRKKRVGNSIINSSVRNGAARGVKLYEAILKLRKPESAQW
jgi:DNA modification methylase